MIYLILFWTFFKIGLFTFGGGYAMLPLIMAEVESHGWLEIADLVNFVAVSESTPGPFAINISTYIGMRTAGLLGAVCSTTGVVLPSFLIILIVARFYMRFRQNTSVQGVLSGLKPSAIGLIAAAVISIGAAVFFPSGFSQNVFTTPDFWISAGIFLAMLVLIFIKNVPILVIVISAVLGIVVNVIF